MKSKLTAAFALIILAFALSCAPQSVESPPSDEAPVSEPTDIPPAPANVEVLNLTELLSPYLVQASVALDETTIGAIVFDQAAKVRRVVVLNADGIVSDTIADIEVALKHIYSEESMKAFILNGELLNYYAEYYTSGDGRKVANRYVDGNVLGIEITELDDAVIFIPDYSFITTRGGYLIAYDMIQGNDTKVVIDLATYKPAILPDNILDRLASSASVSPDGTKLAYFEKSDETSFTIAVYDIQSGALLHSTEVDRRIMPRGVQSMWFASDDVLYLDSYDHPDNARVWSQDENGERDFITLRIRIS